MSVRTVALITRDLATAGMAGCVGGDDDQANRSADGAELDPQAQPGTSASGSNLTGAAFTLDAAIDRTVWANGSFSPQQMCYAGGCPTGSAFQQVELDEEIPDGVPVRFHAQLTYETGPTPFSQPLDMGVFSEDATFYSFESDEERGRDDIEATVLYEGEPIVVQIFYRWPTATEPEASYTLRIDVEADPTTLPAGVPVEIPGEPGQRFTAEPVAAGDADGSGSSSPTLLVYGPDDTLLDRWEGQGEGLDETLPSDAASGAYVLVPPESGPGLRVETNRSDVEVRPLPLSFEGSEPRSVQGPEAVSWSFETAATPLSVGVYMTSEGPASASLDRGSLTLEGPGGSLLDTTFGCGMCITLGYGTGTGVPLGASDLAAGSYTVTYEPTAEAGYAVGHFVVGYER